MSGVLDHGLYGFVKVESGSPAPDNCYGSALVVEEATVTSADWLEGYPGGDVDGDVWPAGLCVEGQFKNLVVSAGVVYLYYGRQQITDQ